MDREPRLVDRKEAPSGRGCQWPLRDFMLTLRAAADTRVIFISLQDDPPEKSLQIALGKSHGYHTSNTWHVVQQKRGSVLQMDGTLSRSLSRRYLRWERRGRTPWQHLRAVLCSPLHKRGKFVPLSYGMVHREGEPAPPSCAMVHRGGEPIPPRYAVVHT